MSNYAWEIEFANGQIIAADGDEIEVNPMGITIYQNSSSGRFLSAFLSAEGLVSIQVISQLTGETNGFAVLAVKKRK